MSVPDSAISALSAATALAGTEVTPVVQSSATVKATMAQIRDYILSAGATFGGALIVAAGDASLPGLGVGAADTGLYYTGGQLAFTQGGALVGYFATSSYFVLQNNGLRFGADAATIQLGASADTILSRSAAAAFQLGAANAASPTAQTLGAQGSRSSTDTNVAGANLTVRSGIGTGNATGSSLIFQTPTAVGSGTGAQTSTTRLTLNSTNATFSGAAVVAAGTNSLPGLGVGASDTGLYYSGGQLAFTQGGVLQAYFSSSIRFVLQVASGIDMPTDVAQLRFGVSNDAMFSRNAAAVWHLGDANAASPVAQTLGAQGSRAATDSNVGGASLTLRSGIGTGTGTISSLALQSPIAVGSGTGAQTSTTGLLIKAGTAVLTSYTVANLPAAGTAGAGATAFVTDASTTLILGLGGTVTGGGANKVPVFSDGTNWIYG